MKTMLPRTLAALLVAAAALPVVAVQAAETLTVQTFNEKNAPVEVVIPKDPKRVAVLDYAVLDTMDAWGLGEGGLRATDMMFADIEKALGIAK